MLSIQIEHFHWNPDLILPHLYMTTILVAFKLKDLQDSLKCIDFRFDLASWYLILLHCGGGLMRVGPNTYSHALGFHKATIKTRPTSPSNMLTIQSSKKSHAKCFKKTGFPQKQYKGLKHVGTQIQQHTIPPVCTVSGEEDMAQRMQV